MDPVPQFTMDFFGAQQRARSKTALLVFYYILAILFVITFIHVAIPWVYFPGRWMAAAIEQEWEVLKELPARTWHEMFKAGRLLRVFAVLMPAFLAGTIYKMVQLSKGGEQIAWLLGGTEISEDTRDPYSRELLKIVEEMSIASGVPRPKVYLMVREPGINAFSAGYSIEDAIIGVTWGCLRMLTRDELQGVIAHEYSHILNGDMTINMRLAGILHGLLFMGQVSNRVFHRLVHAVRLTDDKSSAVPAIIALLAAAPLLAVTYIGIIPARMIKSAICRQREYLADAHAVQFTRHPAGLAGALKVIGGFVCGSRIISPFAEQASHFFTANGLGRSFLSRDWMATHPPIARRIKRIDPFFDGELPFVGSDERRRGLDSPLSPLTMARVADGVEASRLNMPPPKTVPSAFSPSAIAQAAQMSSGAPETLLAALGRTEGCMVLWFCLLLSRGEELRAKQMTYLREQLDPSLLEKLEQALPATRELDRRSRLPLVMQSIETHREHARPLYLAFREIVGNLADLSDPDDPFGFMITRMMRRHLDPVFNVARARGEESYKGMKELLPTITDLLSCVAYWGTDDHDQAIAAFSAGTARLKQAGKMFEILDLSRCGPEILCKSLDTLETCSMRVRKRVMMACAACVEADGTVTAEEIEILRAVGDSLDCDPPALVAS